MFIVEDTLKITTIYAFEIMFLVVINTCAIHLD